MNRINVNAIIHDSIVDGPGLRSVIFTQGCPHKCFNCHNPETWCMNKKRMLSIDEIINEITNNNFTKKVTISGGEPLIQLELIVKLCEKLKELDFHIMLYTGYTIEQIREDEKKEILNHIDILVDGLYIDKLRDEKLLFKGSLNQKIIYLKN